MQKPTPEGPGPQAADATGAGRTEPDDTLAELGKRVREAAGENERNEDEKPGPTNA